MYAQKFASAVRLRGESVDADQHRRSAVSRPPSDSLNLSSHHLPKVAQVDGKSRVESERTEGAGPALSRDGAR